MGKRLIAVILFVLLLFAGSEVLLPMIMSKALTQGIVSLAGSERASTTLSTRPALLMLGGKFDTIHIMANHAKIDKITFSELSIALANAQLDMEKLWNSRLIDLKSVDDVDITAVIDQEELARHLNQSVKGVNHAVVVITSNKIKATSTVSIGGFASVGVSLEGRIVSDSQKIKFVTDQLLINNVATGYLGGSLLTEIPLVDLNKLPFHVSVRDIAMGNGKVTLYLDNRSH